ncbi:MAG: hypothetical protein EXR18_02030 [Flavobacteriaceae bacterium]|nr:hypothetical protein [Flavobacteriaceae bacterium]
MKHLLTTIIAIGFAFTGVQAQEKEAVKAPQEKTTSKEDKAAAKAKKETDLLEAFKTAGVTDEDQQKVRVIMDENAAFGKTLKADVSLSDEDRKAKNKEFYNVSNGKLKELLGAEKYKTFKDVQKAQKEVAKAN